MVSVEFDPIKRKRTLEARGLDKAEAVAVSDEPNITVEDRRWDYAEPRMITIGRLRGRLVVIVWTPRGGAYRIINLRKANAHEQAAVAGRV